MIDGQQRLTTLQLLIAATAKAMADAGQENDSALLRELMVNNPRKATGTDQLKVWPTNANRTAFTAVMATNGPPLGHVDDPHNLIDEAFDYFTECAKAYLFDSDGEQFKDSAATRAERLRVTLCDLLKVVSITLDQDDNAQVIFETLNARGTPLLSLDLVKNALFRRVADSQQDADVLYDQIWRPQLDDDYWRRDRRQGRLNRPVGELFLMHWLTMRLARVIPATELFATFRQRVLKESTDAEVLIRELCADAEVMRSFDSLDVGSPEQLFLNRLLGPLDAGTTLPIVLLLFRSQDVTADRRRRACWILESWLARRALMRWTAKNYNRLVPRLITAIKADIAHADEALLATLSGAEGNVSRWPTDAEFVEFLRTRDAYGTISQSRLVMALQAVEMRLRTSKTEALSFGGGLSIEHLMPQGWETHWPLSADSAEKDKEALQRAAEARAARIHRLGNLTIVARPLNPAMSNATWAVKRSKLNEHTVLLLNSKLTERETWDEQAIEERGEWLASILVHIWPGPNSESFTGTI